MDKIKRHIIDGLKKKFIKTDVLTQFSSDGVTYRVIDRKNILSPKKSKRAICFKKADEPDKTYIHSMVYLDTAKDFQPVMKAEQNVIDKWMDIFTAKNALVLGAAGCSIPRFITYRFPEIKTVGIEYCPEFIDIAEKYFLTDEMRERFTLLRDDAFLYVKKDIEKQDITVVDIFDASSNVPEKAFSEDFISSLYNTMSDTSVAVFNLLIMKKDDAVSFSSKIKIPFDFKAVMTLENRTVLILAKSQNKEKLSRFSDGLSRLGQVIET